MRPRFSSPVARLLYSRTQVTRAFVSATRRPGLLIGLLLLFWCPATYQAQTAQSAQYTQNTPDQTLRSDLRVDPSTLGLSIQVPIAAYPGRAGASLPVTLSYSSKQWRLEYDLSWTDNHSHTYSETHPVFADNSKSGWSSSLSVPYIEWTNWHQYTNGGEPYCPGCPDQTATSLEYFNRIHLHMPDGSTHELRLNDDEASSAATTGVFVAVDGSHIKYDADTQIVYQPDGSRYQLGGASADSYYIDRNGNTLTYHYSTRKWTDALDRELEISLPDTPAAQDYTYYLPKVNGGSASYTVRWKNLGDSGVLSSGSSLNYLSSQCQGASTPAQTPHLFNNVDNLIARNHICSGPNQFNPVVLYQIVLPNGKSYTFNYNEWAEITKVSYPTGGYEKYAYGKNEAVARLEQPYDQANRGVTDRWVNPIGSGTDGLPWHYASTGYLVTTTAPDTSYTTRSIYKEDPNGTPLGYSLSDAKNGMSYEERAYSGTNTMLRRTLTEWATSGPTSGGYGSATRDARPVKQVNIILDTGGDALATTTTMTYDSDLNVISTSHYGFVTLNSTTALTVAIGSVSAGSLLRTDETTYLVNDTAIGSTTRTAYRNRNLLSLPTSTRIKDSSGTVVAQTQASYDETSTYPLLTYSGTMVEWTDPSTNLRGLPTTTGVWLNTTSSYVQTHAQYDQFGNPRNSWDANGNESQVAYSSTYNYAYPSSSTSAVPDSTGVHGSTTALTSSAVYNPATGRVTSSTDANSQTTSYTYDSINRLSTITRPTGGGTTTFDYDDTAGSVNVRSRSSIDSSRVTDSYQYLDGLGRPVRTFVNEGSSSYLTSDTQYDSMGRVWRVSNPYRTTSLTASINPDGYWTTNAYDYLGRLTTVTTPDSAVVTTAYSGSTSTPLGPVVTVTDQAGKLRRSLTDALGQLARVDEPDTSSSTGSLGTVASPNQATSYSYDVLGNLTGVTQGSQSRTFVYNSLGRLTSAANPESGTVSYAYDDNGNLLVKTDARSVSAHYSYDALARPVRRWYNSSTTLTDTTNNSPALPTGIAVSNEAAYFYDNASLPSGAPSSFARGYSSGRLVAVTYGSSSSNGDYNGYDELGRVIQHVQQTDSVNYLTEATYYLNSAMATETYPAVPGASDRRTVNYSLDLAARLSSLSSSATSYAAAASLSSVSYKAHGGLESETLGNSLIHALSYNTRLQTTAIKLGTSGTPTSVLNLSYDYGTTDNNGNVKSHLNTIGSLAITDTFSYDSLNRISSTVETTTSGSGWTENNHYDRYGNRQIDYGSGSYNLAFSSTTNRITTSGYSFDDAGNLLNDGTHAYTFDAENKIKTVDSVAAYTYDGGGRRVRKLVSENTRFIYGIGGELVAEYSGSSGSLLKEYVAGGGMTAVIDPSAGTRYTTSDHLGSPRVITNSSGSVLSRHDYMPFGVEIGSTTSGRSTGVGYGGTDGVRQEFTSKERDNETGLDYFLARYYASTQGRFTSPDPIILSEKQMVSPQTWNLYNYAGNNPLAFTDPTGMELVKLGLHTDDEIDRRRKEIDQQMKQGKKDGTLTKEQKKQLGAEKKTLGLEKDGNKLVSNLLARLPASERQGLQVSDFTLSTDTTGSDFMSDQTFVTGAGGAEGAQTLANTAGTKAMFVMRGYSKEIFINTATQNVRDMMSGDRDWITYGATVVKHEQSHRDKLYNEFQALTEQKRVLDQFGPGAFSSREVYQGHADFIIRQIEKYKPKP